MARQKAIQADNENSKIEHTNILKDVNVNDIKTVSNPRTIFKGIEELSDSIQETGVQSPLLVMENDGDYELVDGERRLRAAKLAGLKTVPCRIVIATNGAVAELKMVANIQREQLTPKEESAAFHAYIKETGHDAAFLAKRIGKPEAYVQRRLLLDKLHDHVTDALNNGKITLSHAVILAQLSKESQTGVLKATVENRYTPQMLSDALSFAEIDQDTLPDDVKRKIAKRGQTTLENIGGDIQRNQVVDKAKVELTKYLEAERNKLREQGIKVWASKTDLLKQHRKAEEVSSYSYDNKRGYDYAKIVKGLPNSEEFGVVISYDNWVEKKVYCFDPDAYAAKRAETKKSATKKTKDERDQDEEAVAQQLNLDRTARLKKKVHEYRHGWRREQIRNLLKPGKVANALLLSAANSGHTEGQRLEMAPATQAKELMEVASDRLDDIDDHSMGIYAKAAGVDPEKHFKLNDEYLELYTKDELLELAQELKVPKGVREEWDGLKKPELILAILKAKPPISVPKIFKEASR